MTRKTDTSDCQAQLPRRRFLQAGGTGLAVAAASTMLPGCGSERPADESRESIVDHFPGLTEFPSLSLKERDRRYRLVREMMRAQDVVGLLVPIGDVHRMSNPNGYFTNDVPATVLFPLEGEPIAVGEANLFSGSIWYDEQRGLDSWIRDWRFGGTRSLPGIIRELGWADQRIGTLGVSDGTLIGLIVGEVSYQFWHNLTEALPDATWVELWDPFCEIWLPKSSEELAVFRKASLLTEAGARVAVDAVRPGANVADLHAEIYGTIMRHGGKVANVFLGGGKHNSYWGTGRYLNRAQAPRVFEPGEVWCVEFGAFVGHLEAWVNMTIAIGEVDPIFFELADVARESYEIAMEMLKPGVRFGDVANAMDEPLKRGGYWHLTPHLYTMNPLQMVSPGTERIDQYPGWVERFPTLRPSPAEGFNMDLVVESGTTFSVQPNASSGPYRTNFGGNVYLTDSGAVSLNEIPYRMNVVPA